MLLTQTTTAQPDSIARAEKVERRRLARNIVLSRARARMSQHTLAQRAGVTRATISNIERASGSAQVGTIFRIASALNTTAAALLSDPELPNESDDDLDQLAARESERAIDTHDLLAAVNEAYGEADVVFPRYSRAGRPRLRREVMADATP
jgi:transcriptional regulator with XRE-family HTH domain